MFRAVVYRSKRPLARQPWRWRIYAANNRKVATSGEGFEHWQDAKSTLEGFLHPKVKIEVEGQA
jgi:uncharacterized protein YegP (UPF0339 family)